MRAVFAIRHLVRWPVAVALGAFLVHLVYLEPGGPSARSPEVTSLSYDEGTVLYDSLRIARGEVMYRDFFEFQGPVFFHIYGGLFAVTGASIRSARVLHILISAVGSGLLAVLVGRFAGRAAGLGAAAFHACILMPMWPWTYPHWLAETLALAGLVLLTTDTRRPAHEIASGVFLGLSLATIQSLGLPLLVCAVGVTALPGIAARDPGQALSRSGRVVLGAGAVFSVILLYFAVRGSVSELFYQTVTWPAANYMKGHGGAPFAHYTNYFLREHATLGQPWRTLAAVGIHLTATLPLVSLPAAALALLRTPIAIWRRSTRYDCVLVAGAALAALAPMALGVTRRDITHLAFVGGIAMAAAAVVAEPLVRRWRAARIGVAMLFLGAGVIALASYANKTVRTWNASRQIGGWRSEVMRLYPISGWILQNVPPDEPIVADGYPGYLYLYVRPSAISHTFVPNPASYLTDAQWRRMADEIVANRPRILFLTRSRWAYFTRLRPEIIQMYGRTPFVLANPGVPPSAGELYERRE